jgi:CRISPR/Cas system-associated protein endoribonuclease Cas2
MRRLKGVIPPEGHVLYVTQAQWDRMFVVHGPPEKERPKETIPEQLLFW